MINTTLLVKKKVGEKAMCAILVILVVNTTHLVDEMSNVRKFGNQHYTFGSENGDVRNFGDPHYTTLHFC